MLDTNGIEQITGATESVCIGGLSYEISPLTIGDLGKITSWLKVKPFADVREILSVEKGLITPAVKDNMLNDAARLSRSYMDSMEVAFMELSNLDGVRQIVIASLLHEHAGTDLNALVNNMKLQEIRDLSTQIQILSGILERSLPEDTEPIGDEGNVIGD